MPTSMTEVDIANRALTKLGSQFISSLTEENERARVMNKNFNPVRQKLLRENTWNFTLTRDTLAADPVAPAFHWTARFAYPSDFMRMVATENNSPFRLEGNFILSMIENSLNITYVADITDTSQYDTYFVEAFAALLAYETSPRLAQDNRQQDQLFRDYNLELIRAKRLDGQEDDPKHQIEDSWINARRIDTGFVGEDDFYTGNGSL